MTVFEAKRYGKKELENSPTPELDCDVILQSVLNLDRTRLLLSRGEVLSPEQETRFTEAVAKRKTGFPVAYIVQKKEFYGFDFFVTPDVLIPKPDTETLVEKALELLSDGEFRAKKEIRLCDMCSGSGCVGTSVLKSLEKTSGGSEPLFSEIVFADISKSALDVTVKNAESILGGKSALFSKCRFVHSNLFSDIPEQFDVILTNPPYVPHFESLELLKDGRSEPLLALDGDTAVDGSYSGTNDGLALIRRLVPESYSHLARPGVLLMETGEYNAEETRGIFLTEGFKNVRIALDLNGMPRVVSGEKS